MPLGVKISSLIQMSYLIIHLTKTNISGSGNWGEKVSVKKKKKKLSLCVCFNNIQGTKASAMEDMILYKIQYVEDLVMMYL